jgi:glycosyltransferase involved in cell wall biosynthesis
MESRECGFLGGQLNLRSPQRLAANSRAAISYAEGQGIPARHLFLLSNVIDPAEWPTRSGDGNPELTLLAAGRLVPVKRFDRFLRLLAQLRSRTGFRGKAFIVGDGPLREQLEALARALGLWPAVVQFRGSADLRAAYRESDIFVLTSEHEGTPNVLLEAMATGLAVVASNTGGISDLVQHGHNGLLFEHDEELCGAVSQLLAELELRRRLGERARRHIELSYSAYQLPGMLNQLYSWALARPGDH